jgi:transposase
MRASTLFRELVNLTPPWKIERILSFSEEKRLEILLKHAPGKEFPCPECGVRLPVRDHVPERSWRHLDSGSFVTVLRARLPRVACLLHGIRQARVPWAAPLARYTAAFEQWAIDVLRETDVVGATRLLRISWDEAWHLMERAVSRGQRRKQRSVVPQLGVDEKAIAKGHSYLTLVCNLDRGTVEYLANDRKKASLDEYYRSLSGEQLAGIEAVAMDMWEPFIASTIEHVPGAAEKIVFDRYHIMMHMGKAVDAVRKRENRLLRSDGDATLAGTKYLWLYGQENIPEEHRRWFAELKQMHLKTGRAWAIKECLRELWHYQRRGWAERHWQRWYSWAIRSRLPEVRRVARTMRSHLPNILTYFAHRITNAVSEGVNSKIQGVKKTPVGSAIATTSRQRSTFTVAAWNSIQDQTIDQTRTYGGLVENRQQVNMR